MNIWYLYNDICIIFLKEIQQGHTNQMWQYSNFYFK